MLQTGQWVALLDLIDGLPSACRLNEAIAQDEDRARAMLTAQQNSGEVQLPWAPRVAEYDLTATLLREIHGGIQGLGQTIIASVGGTPHPVKPFPGPTTAIDRVRRELDREFAADILGMFGFDESYL